MSSEVSRRSYICGTWTLYDANGEVVDQNVEVIVHDDGTLTIGETLHSFEGLIFSGNYIEDRFGQWTLRR